VDLQPILLNLTSLGLIAFSVVTARWALIGFRESKQALRESASYVSAIVSALSSHIESLESIVDETRRDIDSMSNQDDALEDLRSEYHKLSSQVQELIATDGQLLHDIDLLKSRSSAQSSHLAIVNASPIIRASLEGEGILNALTVTERQVIEILSQGSLGAPELGRRLNKSREHMARLMKKLYLEGYVDRESSRPPFRYGLNEKVRLALGAGITESPSEKA